MTIEECRNRQKAYKQMVKNIDVLKLAMERSIAIEELNIADLKKQMKEQKHDRG